MALESEPQSTPLGGSNLDALKSESINNVDLEDGEITDDDDEAVPIAPPAPKPPSDPAVSGPSTPKAPPAPKSQDMGRREQYDNASPPAWMQRRPVSKPPNMSKIKKNNKSLWGPPHKQKGFSHDEDEDDFAVHLEKALQEKAREKAKQAIKEKCGEGQEEDESGEEDNYDRKRKKRKSRDDEGDREFKQRRKHREGEEEEDSMICVRGASPHHNASSSPPYRDYDRTYDSYGEDEDDYDDSPDRGGHSGFTSRGRGRGSKFVRGRGRGRGNISGPNDSGRGGYLNKRGGKRGNHRGLLSKPQRPLRDRPQDVVCMYFMQGKCPKDADECPYSHDAMPRRKMELCKFYNMNCCAKREKCLYMHKDFPCKFFHTGRRCDSGDNCRFSHDKLNDITRSVLLKHIELAPKEILGEFRRLTKEEANQIIDRAARLRSEGKNPEGLDLLRLHDEGDNDSGDERAHTPMPSSPSEIEQNEPESRWSRADDTSRKRDQHDYNRDKDRNRDKNHDRKEHSEKKEHRERKRKRRWDSPDNSPSRLLRLHETLQRQLREQEEEEKSSEKKTSSKHPQNYDGVDECATTPKLNSKDSKSSEASSGTEVECDNSSNFKNSRDALVSSPKDEAPSSTKFVESNAAESGEESQDSTGIIPSHLPKRQRELFLRIQHQQREAEHNEDSKANESDDDATAQDDWYSSDEDGPTSLADVLKNLNQGQKKTDKDIKKQKDDNSDGGSNRTQIKDPLPLPSENPKAGQLKESTELPSRRPPLLPTPTILTDLMKNTEIDQLLSSIRYGPNMHGHPTATSMNASHAQASAENTSSPAGLQSPASVSSLPPAVPKRDPRLSRDPRGRSSSLVGTSPTASPLHNQTDTRPDPRLERGDSRDPRSERRDPRIEQRPETSHISMDSLASPQSDHRNDYRQADPRAAKTENRRTSEGSCSSTGSNPTIFNQHSIYDNPSRSILSGSGDVDLRIKTVAPEAIGDTDFRTHTSQLGAGDMDMRRDLSTSLPGSSAFRAHDTDLRFRSSHSTMEVEENYASASHSDLDLRRMQLLLPFKPAPVHTPATEINASLSSYTPGPYRVVIVDIPKPDFSSLKINPGDAQVKLDPRLRRIFGVNKSEHPSSHAIGPTTPPPESSPQANFTSPAVVPTDPRRRNSSTRPADPRQSRMGAMTGACPPTPRADEYDEPAIADTDLRLQGSHGRQQAQWDNFANRGRGLLPHPEPWSPASTYGHRLPQAQSHPYHQNRSYTPPPM